MKTVMVSGHFDPFTHGHLSYIKQACKQAKHIICVVSSDHQLMMKKGKVNIPEQHRLELLTLIMKGIGCDFEVVLNTFDTETTLVAKALRALKPDIFFRGPDKQTDDMPYAEWQTCQDLGIEIRYGTMEHDVHGSKMII